MLNAAGLRKILKSYVTYYSESRTHLAREKDAPQPRLMCPTDTGPIVAVRQVGGLHHRYDRRAAYTVAPPDRAVCRLLRIIRASAAPLVTRLECRTV